jgi:hypothetical protein
MMGFTSLSERMDPEEMDALMNRVFGTFEEIIKNNDGIVEKYIGDAQFRVGIHSGLIATGTRGMTAESSLRSRHWKASERWISFRRRR